MTLKTMLMSAFCLVMLMPQTVHGQESLSPEDVKLSLQNVKFQESLAKCFKKASRPDSITLVLRVMAQGETQLFQIEDELPPATTSCVSKAVAHLTMPATGSHFQITVSVPVPEMTSTMTITQVDAPPPTPPPSAPPLVAPAAIPLVAAPAVPLVAHPVSTKPAPPPEPAPEWKLHYSRGKKRLIGGIVALGVGFQFAILGGVGFLATLPAMCNGARYYNDEYICRMWTGLGVSLLVLGTAGIITGAILVAQGKRMKKEALESKAQLSIAPLPHGKGIAVGLTWRL